MGIFFSKKFWVSCAGLIFGVLAAKGYVIPQEIRTQVLELIMVIVGAYNVGQGVADGVSGGKTSSYVRHADKQGPRKQQGTGANNPDPVTL